MPDSTSEVLSPGYGLVWTWQCWLMAGFNDLTGLFQPHGSVILGIAVDHLHWFSGQACNVSAAQWLSVPKANLLSNFLAC